MASEPPPLTRAHAVDAIAEELHRRVLAGELPIGARIRQEAIAHEFAVSRQPVREALRKLQATGILTLEPNRGAVVRGPTLREVRERYEIRAELEGLAARRATAAATPALDARLAAAGAAFARAAAAAATAAADHDAAGARAAWTEGNDRCHEAILEASGNVQLHLQVTQLNRVFPRDLTWAALARDRRRLERSIAEHTAVIAAVRARDPRRARERMIAHVLRSGALVAQELAARGALPG